MEPQTETLISEDNYKIQKSYDRRSQGYYLESWGFFDDNRTIFIMSMPLASIHESVDISNKFMAYVGLAALVFGSILMYGTTKMVVSPIRSLQPFRRGCRSWISRPVTQEVQRMKSASWATA